MPTRPTRLQKFKALRKRLLALLGFVALLLGISNGLGFSPPFGDESSDKPSTPDGTREDETKSTRLDRLPYRLVLALDLSTSMNCPVKQLRPPCATPGDPATNPPIPRDEKEAQGLRITAAVNAAQAAFGGFRPGDRLNLWTFSGNKIVDLTAKQTYSGDSIDEIPKPTIQPFRDGKALRAELNPLVLKASGATPLNLATFYGVRALRAGWRDGALNALVLLTDGYDATSRLEGALLGERKLNLLLRNDASRPVHVLVTTVSYDVACDGLFRDVTAFRFDFREDCVPVTQDTDIPTALSAVVDRLKQLAKR